MIKQNFGKPLYVESISSEHLREGLSTVVDEQTKAVLMLVAEDETQSQEHLNEFLIGSSLPIFGGIAPGIIIGTDVKSSGAVIVPIYADCDYHIVEDMSIFIEKTNALEIDTAKSKSLIVLLDGLSSQIDNALNQLFQIISDDLRVFGCGLGSLSFVQKPTLFTPKGNLQNAMALIALDTTWEVSVAHGWEILGGPFLASEVDENTIIDLNYEPAISSYKSAIKQVDKRRFEDHSFFDIAQNYPFGLDRLDDDLLVREPVTEEDGKITCVGKIPSNTMLYILSGDPNKLIAATSDAVKNLCQTKKASEGIIFDCIGRQLYLKDAFQKELIGMANSLEIPDNMFGVLAMGEIALAKSGRVNFHNKTAVMGLLK